jgi:hypothetical protein
MSDTGGTTPTPGWHRDGIHSHAADDCDGSCTATTPTPGVHQIRAESAARRSENEGADDA